MELPKPTGNCYGDSYRTLMEFERLELQTYFGMSKRQNFRVVHGRVTAKDVVTGQIKPMLHAWVEAGPIVWEPFHQITWDKKQFYQEWKAEVFGKFNAQQAAIMVLTRKHLGPWAGPEEVKRNPDESFRRLERGSGDDPLIRLKLLQQQARQGDRVAAIELQLRLLGDDLTNWAETQGRSLLQGEFRCKFGEEHPISGLYYHLNSFQYTPHGTIDEVDGPTFSLNWRGQVMFNEETWRKYQESLKDVRILRPLNEVEVSIHIHNKLEGEKTVSDQLNIEVRCNWNPELIRIGGSWHSGWLPVITAFLTSADQVAAHEDVIPLEEELASHPLFELIDLIEKRLQGANDVYVNLGRQQGPFGWPQPFPYQIEKITRPPSE